MPVKFEVARSAMMAGDRLMVTHPDQNRPNDRTRYHLIGLGRSLTAAGFRKLADDLVPVGDGLLPEITQTYIMRQK